MFSRRDDLESYIVVWRGGAGVWHLCLWSEVGEVRGKHHVSWWMVWVYFVTVSLAFDHYDSPSVVYEDLFS